MKNLFKKIDISLFTPTTKVHMQRDVMREADLRLAKYSRRGILSSLIIFSLALSIGDYYHKQPVMSVILFTGLLFITLLRAYFLQRFETIYAQGPARWRSAFFYLSLLGSSWWGFVTASVTWTNGLQAESPLLWLYTVAFFAGSIYIFAPFQRFLKPYMFVSFIPCSIVAISLAEPMAVLYGAIMIILYFLLCRQSKIIGQNYWDKLQANYELLQKANILKAEKITTESSLNTKNTMLSYLNKTLKTSLNEIIGSLQLLKYSQFSEEDEQLLILSEQKAKQQLNLLRNAEELNDISTKRIYLDKNVIDPRFHIEQALSHVSIVAHKKGIELYSSFDSSFPLRVRSDAERLEQLTGNLVMSACKFCQAGELLLNVSSDNDDSSLIEISVTVPEPLMIPDALHSINSRTSDFYGTDITLALGLEIIKSLSECMGGNAGGKYQSDGTLLLWFAVQCEFINVVKNENPFQVKSASKAILLYQPPAIIANVFSHTLESWGFEVDVVDEEKQALSNLENGHYDYLFVIIYTRLDNMQGLSFSKVVLSHEKFKSLPQIVLLSQLQTKIEEVQNHFLQNPNIEVQYKPIRLARLKKTIKRFMVDDSRDKSYKVQTEDILKNKKVLLFQEEDLDVAIIKAMLTKVGCSVEVATTIKKCRKLLQQTAFDAFICESHITSVNTHDFVKEARQWNDNLHKDNYKIPVLGLTSQELEAEQTQCLASGMDYYIDSPVTLEDLSAVLRRFISRAIHMAEQK